MNNKHQTKEKIIDFGSGREVMPYWPDRKIWAKIAIVTMVFRAKHLTSEQMKTRGWHMKCC